MKNVQFLKKALAPLHLAAYRKLIALHAALPQYTHMAYGISRNSKGQLSTWFCPMTDEDFEVWAYGKDAPEEELHCVHI